MKFENFVKKEVPYGVTIRTESDGNWLYNDGMYVNIPNTLGTIGRITADPLIIGILENHLHESEISGEAHLKEAILRKPDGKNKDIIRVFKNKFGDSVAITNEQFGMIEKKDMCVLSEFTDLEDGTYTRALLIGPYAEIDEFEPEAVILEMEE